MSEESTIKIVVTDTEQYSEMRNMTLSLAMRGLSALIEATVCFYMIEQPSLKKLKPEEMRLMVCRIALTKFPIKQSSVKAIQVTEDL